MKGSFLYRDIFLNADLSYADMRGAVVTGSIFTNANLRGTMLDDKNKKFILS